MRIFISIFLVSILSFGYLSKVTVILNYHLNKASYIEKYCVNKDKPETGCKGKCHLGKQLEANDKEDTEGAPLPLVLYEVSDFLFDGFTGNDQLKRTNSFAIRLSELSYNLSSGYLRLLNKPPIV